MSVELEMWSVPEQTVTEPVCGMTFHFTTKNGKPVLLVEGDQIRFGNLESAFPNGKASIGHRIKPVEPFPFIYVDLTKENPPVIPPELPETTFDEYDERKALADLLENGFAVMVSDPYGETFDKKYTVYEEVPGVGSIVIPTDEYGQIKRI